MIKHGKNIRRRGSSGHLFLSLLDCEGDVAFERARLQPCRNCSDTVTALQAAEKRIALKGHDFSRAAIAAESTPGSAAEGCLSWTFP
jgi:hypothetical protein